MRTKHIIPKHAAGFSLAAGDDPFDAFPDAVLGLIVSHLPFKSAVAVSAVSRRWRHAVAAAPSLDLDFAAAFPAAPRRRAAFAVAASTALSLTPDCPLRRLRLALADFFDAPFAASAAEFLSAWLAAAAARGVEHLELRLPRARHARVPDTLLLCTSLSSLVLHLENYAFQLPSLSPLTALSRLHLSSLSLSGDGFFQELFTHCTHLHHLVIEECHVAALRLAGAPQLCSISITDCSWTPQSSISISAMPSLRTVHYTGAMANTHAFDNTIPLDDVVLDIEKPLLKQQEYDGTAIASVMNVRSLMLSPWCIEQFVHAGERSEVWLDKVKWLTCVIERREEGVLSVPPLLAKCPNVEELSVSVVPSRGMRRRSTDDEAQQRGVGGKGVILRHLRRIRMQYIDESKAGLELVKLLLKNARVLEVMTIVPSQDGLELAKFRRRVSKLRKASRDACVRYGAAE